MLTEADSVLLHRVVLVLLGVFLHMVGDYVIQNDYMAQQKVKAHTPAFWHALTYTLLFLLATRSVPALLAIGVTHFIIDRWRLARYVVWFKNLFAPKQFRTPPWAVCKDSYGFPPGAPPHIAFWVMVICDNLLHIAINSAALWWLA